MAVGIRGWPAPCQRAELDHVQERHVTTRQDNTPRVSFAVRCSGNSERARQRQRTVITARRWLRDRGRTDRVEVASFSHGRILRAGSWFVQR